MENIPFLQDILSANLLDILIIIFLLYGIMRGFRSGLVGTLGSLLAVVIAFFIAGRFYDTAYSWFSTLPFIQGENGITISFFILYFVVYIFVLAIIRVFFHVFDFLAHIPGLGLINKILGVFVGVIYTIVILSGFLYFLQEIAVSDYVSELISRSNFSELIHRFSFIFQYLIQKGSGIVIHSL